jgi:hypothetical protein
MSDGLQQELVEKDGGNQWKLWGDGWGGVCSRMTAAAPAVTIKCRACACKIN